MLFALFLRRGIWGSLVTRVPYLELFPTRRRLVLPDAPPAATAAEES